MPKFATPRSKLITKHRTVYGKAFPILPVFQITSWNCPVVHSTTADLWIGRMELASSSPLKRHDDLGREDEVT